MQQRQVMSQLVEHQHIAPQDIDQALFVSQVYPPPSVWHGFITKLLLWFGSLAMACAVVFFVAANWQEMGRLSKFVLLQFLVVAAVVVYLRVAKNSLFSQVALTAAFILLGALMAYFGQTYQTGADPWQLFFNWALLGLPWVVIARFAPLWLLLLTLLNLSVYLYHDALGAIIPFGLARDESLFWCLLILNNASLALWEWCRVKHPWLNQQWVGRLLAIATIYNASGLALIAIFSSGASWLGAIAWLLLMAAAYVIYRQRQPNLFILALCCLSTIVVVVAWFANLINHIDDAGMYILLFFLTIGLTTGAAVWLKKLMKEFQ